MVPKKRVSDNIAIMFLEKPLDLIREDGINAACLPACNNMFDHTFVNHTGKLLNFTKSYANYTNIWFVTSNHQFIFTNLRIFKQNIYLLFCFLVHPKLRLIAVEVLH